MPACFLTATLVVCVAMPGEEVAGPPAPVGTRGVDVICVTEADDEFPYDPPDTIEPEALAAALPDGFTAAVLVARVAALAAVQVLPSVAEVSVVPAALLDTYEAMVSAFSFVQ